MTAASVSLNEMTILMEHLPAYEGYSSRGHALSEEKVFRRTLGQLLKDCGDHLLCVAEKKSMVLSGDQEEILDLLVDHISSIFRRLDREGQVVMAGNPLETVPELEELDNQLLLLAEESLTLTRDLDPRDPADSWFRTQAIKLSQDLAELSRTTEERNYLLGLGWESEFAQMRRR